MKKKHIFIFAIVFATAIVCSTIYKLRKLESPKTDKPLIICIGDSITYGAGVNDNRKKEAWPYLLDARYESLNYGIPGATMQENTKRSYKAIFWHRALRLKADLYILMLGTNDMMPENWNEEQYIMDLNKKILQLKTVSDRVVLLTPPPIFKAHPEDPFWPYNINPDLCITLKDIIETTAEEQQLTCIDIYSLMKDHPEYMADGVHPDKEGNQLIAEAINVFLEKQSF